MISVETMPKTGRRIDPPRSRWSCSCGAGNPKLVSPEAAHAEADAHVCDARREERAMKPGSLCQLGDRSVFKVGYVLGSSRSPGKTRVRSYSASADAWSNAFAITDDHVLPLPARDTRTAWQRRVIERAVLSSAKARQEARGK